MTNDYPEVVITCGRITQKYVGSGAETATGNHECSRFITGRLSGCGLPSITCHARIYTGLSSTG